MGTQDWVISEQGKPFALQAGADLVDQMSAESVFMVT